MHHHSIRTVHTNGFSASYSTHGEDQPLLGSLETLHHNLLASDTNLALTHRRRDGEGERMREEEEGVLLRVQAMSISM